MMFYTDRIANSAADGQKLGGSANDWDKAAMNTAVAAMKLVLENVMGVSEPAVPDAPKLLHCKPQSEARLADIMMSLVDGVNPADSSPALPTADDILTKLEPLVDLLWNEECNAYLIESDVSYKPHHNTVEDNTHIVSES